MSRVEFVPLPDRPFVTVDVELLADEETETDQIVGALTEHDLSDAVVRIRVKATEEQWRRVDAQAVRRHVEENGGRLVQIIPELVRSARPRVDGVDETLAPATAVGLWLEAQEVPAIQRDGVLGLLDAYLAAA